MIRTLFNLLHPLCLLFCLSCATDLRIASIDPFNTYTLDEGIQRTSAVLWSHYRDFAAANSVTGRKTIFIFDAHRHDKALGPISLKISDILTANAASIQLFRIIDRTAAASFFYDKPGRAADTTPSQLLSAGKMLNAELMLITRIDTNGNEYYTVRASIVSVESGAVCANTAVRIERR
ncbi:MAG: hypothetical protein HZC28_07965 [Spirochaetes bacterium]|nr:hypothetical protein [Spirochaetota bacterium]